MNCTISLFGPTSASCAGRRLAGGAFEGRKPRQVLALLALAAGRPLSRDALADRLWEGRPPRGHVTTLQGYVCVLRRALATIGAESCLVTTQGGYLIDPDRAEVDLDTALRSIRGGGLLAVLDGLDLAATGLLPDDQYTSWADEARDAWDRELAEAARVAASRANEDEDHVAAIRLARSALALAPYSEGALRELMLAMASVGRRSEALEAFHDTRERLRADLGLDLQQSTADLYGRILAGSRPDTPDEAPLLVSLLLDALRSSPRASAGQQETWAEVGHLLLRLAQ